MVPAQKKHIISWACRKIVKTSVLRNASPSKSIAQGKTLPMQSIAFQVSQGNDSINVISLYSHSSWTIHPRLRLFCFTSLCDWSKKIASRFQPNRCTRLGHPHFPVF